MKAHYQVRGGPIKIKRIRANCQTLAAAKTSSTLTDPCACRSLRNGCRIDTQVRE